MSLRCFAQPVFGSLPQHTARMLRGDLAAARKAWIDEAKTTQQKEDREKADFLTYEDSAGRVADFHSQRHTYISMLVAGGASAKEAQQLARHSTARLTIDRYSHTRLHDMAGALEALPAVGNPDDTTEAEAQQNVLRATGTDDAVAHGVDPLGTMGVVCRIMVSSAAAIWGRKWRNVAKTRLRLPPK